MLEPLLFYVLHRASREITDPARLATFKAFLLDEAWLFIRNETIRSYITQAQKTWRKHNTCSAEPNAYFAIIPGNYRHNLRRLYLLNSNYADLSFLFTILAGETRNEHLGAEYLAVLETDHATPYFLNLHNRDVAHTLILGATGAGKSFLANVILQNAQKYKPL